QRVHVELQPDLGDRVEGLVDEAARAVEEERVRAALLDFPHVPVADGREALAGQALPAPQAVERRQRSRGRTRVGVVEHHDRYVVRVTVAEVRAEARMRVVGPGELLRAGPEGTVVVRDV